MCQYSARNGYVTAHHLVHYGKFALGGAGLVFLEATAVTQDGRITNGCPGLWEDGQRDALRPVAQFLKDNGAIPAIQIAHAGRKASMQRPWHGNGPQTKEDTARGDEIWQTLAPSALALDAGWLVPKAMDSDDLNRVRAAFAAAAVRVRFVNLDDLGTEIAEERGAERARPYPGHVQDPYSVQCRLHTVPPGSTRGSSRRYPLRLAAR